MINNLSVKPTRTSRLDFANNIPSKEERVSSVAWLRQYSLVKMKLDLNAIVSATKCLHTCKDDEEMPSARHCSILPTVNIHGVRKHLHIQEHELEKYEACLSSVLKRYLARIKWLQSGSRRVFGTILEMNVMILIDVSGSMVDQFNFVKDAVDKLLWDQLQEYKINFNIATFSSEVNPWSVAIVNATNRACKSASAWLQDIECSGGTCTLNALKFAYSQSDVEAIYLLTDGKPDTSMAAILKEVERLRHSHQARIHTISFNCADNSCDTFLRSLAETTKGRFHKVTFTTQLPTPQENSNPRSDPHHGTTQNGVNGDDIDLLIREADVCRKYILQSQDYRKLIRESMLS